MLVKGATGQFIFSQPKQTVCSCQDMDMLSALLNLCEGIQECRVASLLLAWTTFWKNESETCELRWHISHVVVILRSSQATMERALHPRESPKQYTTYTVHFNGLVQDCSISITNTLEILQSCPKPWFVSRDRISESPLWWTVMKGGPVFHEYLRPQVAGS